MAKSKKVNSQGRSLQKQVQQTMERSLDMIESGLENELAQIQELIQLQIGKLQAVTEKYHLEMAHFKEHMWRVEAIRRVQLNQILKEKVRKMQHKLEKYEGMPYL